MRTLIVTFLLAICFPLLAGAQIQKMIDGVNYLLNDDGTATVAQNSWRIISGDVVIPSSVTYESKTYTVTALDESCFNGCSDLTSITIPSSVTKLGKQALSGCSGLTAVNFTGNFTSLSLGEFCFMACTNLASITIPSGVTKLSANCFERCTSLSSVDLPRTLVTIDEWCFQGCKSLKTVDIPEGVTSIGNRCFWQCASLTSITFPSTVNEISQYCLGDCPSLTSIVVAPGNKTYDSRNNCNAVIETEYNMMIIGCKNTTIPVSVTSLDEVCFWDCTSLTSIDITDGVTLLGDYCFSGCKSLESVTLGRSVKTLGESCFWECTSLKTIVSKNITPPELDPYAFENLTTSSINLKVPRKALEAYKSSEGWKDFNYLDYSDVNNNGTTDITDVNMMINKVLSKVDVDNDLDDINADNVIDITDVNSVINPVLGK